MAAKTKSILGVQNYPSYIFCFLSCMLYSLYVDLSESVNRQMKDLQIILALLTALLLAMGFFDENSKLYLCGALTSLCFVYVRNRRQ